MVSTAAIYVRISQDREGSGLGVARQEEDCRALCAQMGFRDIHVYADNDVSAFSGKPRPAYEQMLKAIQDGRVDCVVSWHTDRLHRNVSELSRYISIARDIPTHTVKSGLLDLSTPSGRMIAVITGAVAQQESEHKSERQKRKAEELASKGLPLGGGRPFGYEADGVTVRPTEAEELRGMVARVLAGDSLASIMRDLNDRGVTTTRGNRWGYSSIRSLLLRERNCGRMRHRGEVVGMASWEPLVSEAEHDAIVAVLSAPSRRTSPGPARRHLLSGIARCSCGTPMKPGWVLSRGQKHWIYKCPEKGPGHAYRKIDRVDAYVVERTLDVLSCVNVARPSDDKASVLETQRVELQTRLRGAADLYSSGQISAEQLAAITARVNDELTVVLAGLNDLQAGSLLTEVENISLERWDELPLDRKRKIIHDLMEVVVEPVDGSRRLGVRVSLRHGSRFSFRIPRELKESVRAAAR
jgi:site-specific DNA recombinase